MTTTSAKHTCTCSTPFQRTLDDLFTMQDVRAYQRGLWKLYELAIGNPEVDGWDALRRSNITFLYRQIHDLIESAEQVYDPTIDHLVELQ